MIIHKAISLRPSIEVKYFTPPKELQALRAEYMRENKITEQTMSLSDDQLTRTVITIFATEAIFLEYISSDPVRNSFTIRMNHNEKNEIVEVLSMSNNDGNPYYIKSS